MYGSDNFRELFCSWWEDKTYVDVVSEKGVNQRTSKVWYIGQCKYCGLLVRDEFSFCPNCGKAMNDDAAKIVKYRLDKWKEGSG